MTIPSITPLPTAPVRSDSTTFETRADALMTALPTMVTELNATTTAIDAVGAAVDVDAAAAAASAASSVGAQAAAEAAAAVSAWVSGTTYAVGDVRYSLVNYLSYRRKVSGGGTPSA